MKPRTLDQLLGDKGWNKFGTLKESEFEKKLDEIALSKTDFQDFAAEHGVRVMDDIPRAKQKILEAFRQHTAGYATIPDPTEVKQGKNLKNLAVLMREGK